MEKGKANAVKPGEYRVLIIDPDPLSRDIAGTMLRHVGFRVLEADSAEEGIRRARDADPAVIVTELFERAGDDQEAAERSGVARFLPKPTSPRELEEVVVELLSTRL